MPNTLLPSRRRTWLLRGGLVVMGLMVGLGFSEIGVCLLGLAPRMHPIDPRSQFSAYQYSDNPILGYELKPNFRSSIPDLHDAFPSTNAFGQRDVERTVERQAGHPRILMLGDSVVAGHGIHDVQNTIPLRLQTLLAKQGTEVLNFGVGGYCTLAEIELLRVKGLAFRPDTVILIFVFDDYENLNDHVRRYQKPRPA